MNKYNKTNIYIFNMAKRRCLKQSSKFYLKYLQHLLFVKGISFQLFNIIPFTFDKEKEMDMEKNSINRNTDLLKILSLDLNFCDSYTEFHAYRMIVRFKISLFSLNQGQNDFELLSVFLRHSKLLICSIRSYDAFSSVLLDKLANY